MLVVRKAPPQAAAGKNLKDVQSEQDQRNIPLKHAGIKNLRWPVTLKDKEQGEQHTVAQVSLSVDLPHDLRGTHMSRFVEVLQQLGTLSPDNLEGVLDSLKEHLQAEKAFLELRFPYFISKQAPVSGMRSLMDLDCVYQASKSDKFNLKVSVRVPIQTLCPCSKEISDFGAHNQRAYAEIEVVLAGFVWIEELAQIADAGASAPIYGLLKRPDEKFVTETAYQNPRFVEDAVREIALRLEKDKRIAWYKVTVESMESIHNHSAFACVEKGGW
jgi:GTP cyclohydrolase I